ncbi:ketopantoate reductase family protein [Pseudomonas ovata]|uniref:ketopantoate reductase family protein n=1 Tax=Pseudomonas ovata TaxID=1839709 RepID=UPI000D689BAA|nr:ketopantoate reductase family protein [Pseudomonas ovata]
MRILMVGAGAVGGYFGGRLLEAGRNVTFLVRPRRAEKLERDGLRVRSPHGDIHYPSPPCVLAHQLTTPFDLIVLTCKAYDLEETINDCAPAVGPGTAILPLLNGMAHLDRLVERFGPQAVLGGQCLASLDHNADGVILHLGMHHQLRFGELSGASNQRILRVAEALADAGFDASFSQHILQDMWDKWCFIATLAAVTGTLRAALGDVLAGGGEPLLVATLQECAQIALAAGHPLSAQAQQQCLAMLTTPGSTLSASLLRDIERGATTEGEHVLGDLLARRQALGVAPRGLSMLEVACIHLRAFEVRRRRGG